VSVGVLLSRGVETLAVVSIATGDAFADQRHIYAIFSAHASWENKSGGAATVFLPTATSATSCLHEFLDATEIRAGHPESNSDSTLLDCTARVFVVSDRVRDDKHDSGTPTASPLPPSEPVSPGLPGNERPYDYSIRVYSFRSAAGAKLESNPTSSTSNVLRRSHGTHLLLHLSEFG